MSLVVTLKPGMPGYEKHRLDYICSNYTGEYGYRHIKITDVKFAHYVYEQTGVHIDLGSRMQAYKGACGAISSWYRIVGEDGEPTRGHLNLTVSPSKYMKYALYVDSDPFEPSNLILLIKPRIKSAIKNDDFSQPQNRG